MATASKKNNVEAGTIDIQGITVDSSATSKEFSAPIVKTFKELADDSAAIMKGVRTRFAAKVAKHGKPMLPKGAETRVVRIGQQWEIPVTELSAAELAHNSRLNAIEGVQRALINLAKHLPSNVPAISVHEMLALKTCV